MFLSPKALSYFVCNEHASIPVTDKENVAPLFSCKRVLDAFLFAWGMNQCDLQFPSPIGDHKLAESMVIIPGPVATFMYFLYC